MNARSVAMPVLVAGLVMGLLGNLPFVNLLNCVLCLWVWVGGALAVVLYRRSPEGKADLSPGRGAGLGAMAGVVGALIGFVVFLLTASISGPIIESMARALEVEGDLPLSGGASGMGILEAVIFLAVDLVLYPGFGALGGLVAANLSKSRPSGASAV